MKGKPGKACLCMLLLLVSMIHFESQAYAQKPTSRMITVIGNVSDESGEPLAGVSVMLQGTKIGVSTDADGNYTIRFLPRKEQENIIVYSFIGMEEQTFNAKASVQNDVILKSLDSELDQVVVNGFYTQKKSTFTGAATTIKGETLVELSPTNLLAGIAAMTPGMVLVENNAAGSNPNAIPSLLIRGASSLITNESEEGVNNPLIILDGVEISMEELYDLDIFDIERVDVLKDASATILYGEKGANGVIVVERKRIENAKARLSYNFVPQFSVPDLSSFNLTDASQKLELERLAGLYDTADGSMDKAYAYKLKNVRQGVNTDWIHAPLRVPFSHQHSLMFSAKGQSVDYRANVRFADNYGVMRGDRRRNYSIGFNVNYHTRDKLTVSFRTTYTLTDSKDSPYGDFSSYSKLNPYEKVYDEDGNYIKNYYFDPFNTNSERMANPLYDATLSSFSKARTQNLTSSLTGKWNITKHLDISGQANMTISSGTSDKYVSPDAAQYVGLSDVSQKGSYAFGSNKGFTTSGKLVISYGLPLDKKGSLFRISGGSNIKRTSSNTSRGEGRGFLKDGLSDLSFALGYAPNGKPTGRERIATEVGFFVNGNLGFLNRYILDGSFRTSGSSRFGADNSFAPFWSVGLAWNIHNEPFLKDVKWINSLVPRFSLGYTGTVSFDYYQAKTIYEYKSDYDYYTGIGAGTRTMGNPDLKWQKKLSRNIGITAAMLDNRLNVEFNWYNNTTYDLLMPINLPYSVGVSSMNVNFGQINNSGIDLSLSGRILNTRDWSWVMVLTGGHVMDKIKNISTALKGTEVADASDAIKPKILFTEGGSQFDIYAMRSAGIDPATGQEIFIKKDGSYTYNYNSDDRVAVGNTNPILQGSWINTWRYKGFSLSLTTTYTFGGDFYNSTLQGKVENINPKQNVDARAYTDRWKKPGDLVRYLAINSTRETVNSERFVEKRNELYFSSINVAYEFNTKFMSKIGLKKLSVGFGLSDLGYLSSVKFERGTSYPYCRAINLTFRPTF